MKMWKLLVFGNTSRLEDYFQAQDILSEPITEIVLDWKKRFLQPKDVLTIQ
jgi:hypothetical protein